MPQYELNLRDYLRMLRKRKQIILTVTLLVASLTLSFSRWLRPTPAYEAESRVEFSRTTSVTGLFREMFSPTPAYISIATQTEVIKSYQVMERVVKDLGLIPPQTPSMKIRESPDLLNIFTTLQEQIRTRREGDTHIISITATASNPKQAERLANAVARAYREENIYTLNRQVLEAKRFIEEQLDDVGRKLTKAEEALRSFKEEEGHVFLSEEARAALARVTRFEDEREKVSRIKRETALLLDGLKKNPFSSPKQERRIFTEEGSPALALLNTRLLELFQEREILLINYTREHPQVIEVGEKIEKIRQEMIKELSSKLEAYQKRERMLEERLEELREEYLTVPQAALDLSRLEREIKVYEELYGLLNTKYQEAKIKEAEQIEEVRIIKVATPPAKPVNAPNLPMNLFVGTLMGGLLGIIVGIVRESLDTSIGTIEEVEEFLKLPVLGVIPNIGEKELVTLSPSHFSPSESKEITPRLITLLAPKSPLSESYRSLRTSIQFSVLDRQIKTVEITSTTLREGKTTILINLALSVSQTGKRVLVVDADLRNPVVHKAFGIERGPGLTDVLLGHLPWQDAKRTAADLLLGRLAPDCLFNTPDLDYVHLLTSGVHLPKPSEILSSARMDDLLAQLQDSYDLVLFDTPPLLPVTDALILGSKVGGTLMVYQVGRVARMALKRALLLLGQGQARVIGIILNNVRSEVSPEYTQYRYYPSG